MPVREDYTHTPKSAELYHKYPTSTLCISRNQGTHGPHVRGWGVVPILRNLDLGMYPHPDSLALQSPVSRNLGTKSSTPMKPLRTSSPHVHRALGYAPAGHFFFGVGSGRPAKLKIWFHWNMGNASSALGSVST